ncbi:MAG: DUF554 domain-containing protein [Ruminococcaceae bacterium]|nr:DUF554 domain-containing protein [Oscillospiraceae bacterium]
MGTLVNCIAVILGGIIGLIFKKLIRQSWVDGINKALGIAVLVVGINGVLSNMLTVTDSGFSTSGELILIVSLVLGTLTGEVLNLDGRFTRFTEKMEKKFNFGGFSAGFISSTVLFCVGAMAIIGSVNDGLTGDSSVLFIKSALDFTAAIVLAATLGWGVIFSFVPLLIYQGGITLLAGTLGQILVGELLKQVCYVGYAIIMCIGLNFLVTNKIKTLNMLPAVVVPVIYSLISGIAQNQ